MSVQETLRDIASAIDQQHILLLVDIMALLQSRANPDSLNCSRSDIY